MKKTLTYLGICLVLLNSCKKDNANIEPTTEKHNSMFRYSGPDYSQHIPRDTAERMVNSYLESIDYTVNTSHLTDFTFNADSMRNFLSNTSIATLKFTLAHKRSYMNANNFGVYASTSAAALTFVLAGLDEEDDDFIYASGGQVYNLSTSERLCIDTANKMIQSYLNSIGYPENNTQLRSLTFDADTMRNFLLNPSVVNIKFVIAHRDDYINNGNYGVYCGTNASGFTFIIVGLNSSNQVIYTNNNKVMEHTKPCPVWCSSSALLTQPI